MQVIPGKSVGPFRLGACMFDVVEWLRQHAMSLKHNQMLFNQTDVLSGDIILVVNALGVRLRFESTSQRLKLIDCFDLSKTGLVYSQTAFSGSVVPTFRGVYKTFGATYPGAFHPTKSLYLLQYPGVCFFFHVSPETKQRAKNSSDLAAELGDSAVANRIVIHSGTTLTGAAHAIPPPIRDGDLYFEPAQLYTKKGIFLSKRRKFITFDFYTQDVLTELGSPAQVFVKQLDQMKIHTKSSPNLSATRLDGSGGVESRFGGGGDSDDRDRDPDTTYSDYLLNYFALGIDIVFDGGTHRIKKFIMHTNAIGSADFNQYRKCNFQLMLDSTMQRLRLKNRGSGGSGGSGGGSTLAPAVTSPSGGAAGATTSVAAATGSSVSAFLSSLTGSTTHFASLSPTYAAASNDSQFGWNTAIAGDTKTPPTASAVVSVSDDNASAAGQSGSGSGGGGGKKKNKNKTKSPQPSPPTDVKTIAPALSTAAAAPAPTAVSPPVAAPTAPNAPSIKPAPIVITTSNSSSVSGSGSGSGAAPLLSLPNTIATLIDADTKWSVVQSVMSSHGLETGRPMVHNSSKKENPFGSTYFYAFDGLLFEVLRDGYIKTVSLFSEF